MIRRFIASLVGAGLLLSFAVVVSGCSDDPGQASRGSVAAPRKGGGVQDTAGEKFKTKATAKAKGGKTSID
jgi:hypothetical protein